MINTMISNLTNQEQGQKHCDIIGDIIIEQIPNFPRTRTTKGKQEKNKFFT